MVLCWSVFFQTFLLHHHHRRRHLGWLVEEIVTSRRVGVRERVGRWMVASTVGCNVIWLVEEMSVSWRDV